MSTSEKTQEGNMVSVKVRSAKEFIDSEILKSVALQHALLYERTVHRIIVESEVDSRPFGMLLATTVAVGADLGPFSKGPGAKVWYISGSGDVEADKLRMKLIFKSLNTEQREKFIASLTMYHRGMEGDDQIDLTTKEGREILKKSIPTGTKAIVIDYLPGFFSNGTICRTDRKELDSWFGGLSKQGVTVVVFDVETKARTMLGESRAKNTIYLEQDATAPTQFGGGHLIRRSRVDDADSMPKCVSFWHTKVDGVLSYGFAVPDDEDIDAPKVTKRLERQIKVALMLSENMPQKSIAEELNVHAATICRDVKEIDLANTKAAKANARSSAIRLQQ
jgi:hypothetical protein